MKHYRKKPVVIQAVQWNGVNTGEVLELASKEFVQGNLVFHGLEDKITIFGKDSDMAVAFRGDYLIRGVQGELYPCPREVFEQTYELVEQGNEQ